MQKRTTGFRRGIALLMTAVLLVAALPAYADTAAGEDIEVFTGETMITLGEAALLKCRDQEEGLDGIRVRRNGHIFGRGLSDEPSGIEPDYVGLVGYAAVANNGDVHLENAGTDTPWSVPAYMVFDKRWYYTRALKHKTGVLVVGQMLKAAGGGRYTGRLKVIRLNDMETCWMDVENFVTVPYWFYPVRRAVKYGNTVALYRKGKRPPTDEEGKPAAVDDDVEVLIPGYGVWERRIQAGSGMIPGIIYEERITYRPKKVEKPPVTAKPADAETAKAADAETAEAAETKTAEAAEAETAKAAEAEETVEEILVEVREVIATVLLFPEEDLTMIY